MTELKDIINYVKDSWNESYMSDNTVSNEMLLDCATRIYNSQSFKGKVVEPSGKESIKENKSIKTPPSDKMKYSLINNYGYTESEVDEMDYQTAYDTIKKEKEIERLEKKQ